MKLLDIILGRRLETAEEKQQTIGPLAGVSMVGLDALGSSAYGPEASLTVLLSLGLLGLDVMLPVTGAIILLLFLVAFSYKKIVEIYPTGGGSYVVARENLGWQAGVMAAASLILDYTLAVAVGISAGIGALISAFPILQPYTLELCLGLLAFLAVLNLRGVRQSSFALMIPAYGFILALGGVILFGVVGTIFSHGHPIPVDPVRAAPPIDVRPLTFWLLAHAYSSGSAALTGVEAVSNATPAFHEPHTKNANRTLGIIVVVLATFLAGIAFLSRRYHIYATIPGEPGYESIISQITHAVVGHGFLYYVTMGFSISVLALSANTGFVDFPRVCNIVARDNFLPHRLGARGRRLVYSNGIIMLSLFSGILLVIFGGVTDRLIHLFAIGAYLSFSFAQFGLAKYCYSHRGKNWRIHFTFSLVGGLATTATAIAALLTKFFAGAWLTAVIVPALIFLMISTRRHYFYLQRELKTAKPIDLAVEKKLIAVVPVKEWGRMASKALRFALEISDNVFAVHVKDEDTSEEELLQNWAEYVEKPLRARGENVPKLKTIPSPHRVALQNILEFIDQLNDDFPGCMIAVVIPQVLERKWYQNLLHGHRATLLKAGLIFRRHKNVVVVTVPWFVGIQQDKKAA